MRDVEAQEYDTFGGRDKYDSDIRVYNNSFLSKLRRSKLLITIVVLVALGLLATLLLFVLLESEHDPYLVHAITAKMGAVASDNANCSRIGVDILEAGGNAVDASVSVALCLGVLQPFASGIGGGGFMMVHLNGKDGKNDTDDFFNFREMAPSAAKTDMFYEDPSKSQTGALAVAVPGELKGLYEAHSMYGELPWKQVVEPVMNLAKYGFPVFPLLADRIRNYNSSIMESTTLKSIYAPNGILLQEGDHVQLEALGRTLEAIAEGGSDALYNGPIGDALVADIQNAGGIITKADLQNYYVERMQPHKMMYNGKKVHLAPLPASGAVVGFALNLLEGYKLDQVTPALRTHYITEALKHAFAHRYLLGDASYTANMTAFVDEMLSKEYATRIRQEKIAADRTFPVPHYLIDGLLGETKGHGTSHFSVVDRHRNTVAMTTTVNLGWGSKMISLSTGILLNDQMDDFTTTNTSNAFGIPPSIANQVYPGKRPLSSMAPTIVLAPNKHKDGDHDLLLSLGASGGPYIVSSVLESLVDLLDLGMTPYGSMRKARFHTQLLPAIVSHERGLSETIIDSLISRGHNVTGTGQLADGQIGGVCQSIRNDAFSELLFAVSDWRKQGRPAGY